MVRGGRATNFEPEKQVKFAFLQLPDSPVEPVDGMARIAGNEARAPRLEVRNRSERSIRYLEVGWILQDRAGREFLAGSVPAELNLAPGQKSRIFEDATLKFPQLRSQSTGYRRDDRVCQQRGIHRWYTLDSHTRRFGIARVAACHGSVG